MFREEAVIERIRALDEPWRERLLRYIAARAGAETAGDAGLELEKVRQWLEKDPVLCRDVKLILHEWSRCSCPQ